MGERGWRVLEDVLLPAVLQEAARPDDSIACCAVKEAQEEYWLLRGLRVSL